MCGPSPTNVRMRWSPSCRRAASRPKAPGVGLAILMDFLLPLKDKQISLAHPKAHFRRVFEITGMAQDFRILEAA
jgi:hypothetical protein